MADRQRRIWFAAKRFGYGSGMPIAWQGWMVLAVFLVVTVGTPIILPPRLVMIIVPIAIVILCMICARTTEGGWHWRWGNGD